MHGDPLLLSFPLLPVPPVSRWAEARARVGRGQVAGLSVVYSELLRCLHSFSLGHVETKPRPSQDDENLGELSSPDVGEGRVGQDTTAALVRASMSQGWRRTTGVQTSTPGSSASHFSQAARAVGTWARGLSRGRCPEVSPGQSPGTTQPLGWRTRLGE